MREKQVCIYNMVQVSYIEQLKSIFGTKEKTLCDKDVALTTEMPNCRVVRKFWCRRLSRQSISGQSRDILFKKRHP